jgi:hypothetical protein
VRFFFDNCVSVKFVQALSILAQIQEYELVHLTERFAPDTTDEEWIRTLATDGDWGPHFGRSEDIERPGSEKSVAGLRLDGVLLCRRLGE